MSSSEEAKHVEIPLGDTHPHFPNLPRPGKPKLESHSHSKPEMTESREEPTKPIKASKHHHHHHTIYFNDGKRLIDFVLVYVTGHLQKADLSRAGRVIEKEKQRLFFEDNLRKEGLELEEDVHVHEGPHSETTTFIKVHAPWNVLCRQAEILKLKQPTRLNDPYADAPLSDGPQPFLKALRAVKAAAANRLDLNGRGTVTPEPAPTASTAQRANTDGAIHWPFSRKYIEMFAIDDRQTFFWPSRRHEMVWEVLQNSHNDPDDEKRRGIETLLERGIYESAFPLHDGPYEVDPQKNPSEWCERQILKQTWADWRSVFKNQPLPLIRK